MRVSEWRRRGFCSVPGAGCRVSGVTHLPPADRSGETALSSPSEHDRL